MNINDQWLKPEEIMEFEEAALQRVEPSLAKQNLINSRKAVSELLNNIVFNHPGSPLTVCMLSKDRLLEIKNEILGA